MENTRALLDELRNSELSGGAICAVLGLVLEERDFRVSDYHGKLREQLPGWLTDHELVTRKGKSTGVSYKPSERLLKIRRELRAHVVAKQLNELAPPTGTPSEPPQAPPVLYPSTVAPPQPGAIAGGVGAAPPVPLAPWARGAAAVFLARPPHQQHATLLRWIALGYEQDIADLLISACANLKKGQPVEFSAVLEDAARNAEVLAVKLHGAA